MKRLMVIQHESDKALGTWAPILKAHGQRLRFVNFERAPEAQPSLDGYRGVILLGGEMGVYETESYGHLNVEFQLIEEALRRELPILGVCLGSQILAQVLGATVRKHSEREMGWYPVELTDAGRADPVFGHFGPTERVFQSHGDVFGIPQSAVHLARSALCEGQAFRYGTNVYGLQFHLEMNRAIVDDCLAMPQSQAIFASSGGKFDPVAIRRDTDLYLGRSISLGEEFLRRYLARTGARTRPVRLGSGHGK